MDHLTRTQRSHLMASIRGKDTHPEIAVRRVLHAMGFRFRLYRKDLPGKPDIVLPKLRTVIFVHGCYWHRHPCCKDGQRMPATNAEVWAKKFQANVARDKKNWEALETLGWRVLVLWECQTRDNLALAQYLFTELVSEADGLTLPY